jgi:hypothetical protein
MQTHASGQQINVKTFGGMFFDAALSGVLIGAVLGRSFFTAALDGMLFEAACHEFLLDAAW